MIAIIPALLALIGLLMWILPTNALVKEIGKIFFFCGVFVTTQVLASHTVKLF